MKKNRTLFSPVFFILLMTAPLAFNTFSLIQERLHFHQMQETLEQKSLQTLHLPESAITWIIPGKELRIDGKLFDVKCHTLKQGWMTIEGLFDEEEESIRESLVRYTEAHHPLTEPKIQLLASLLTPALVNAYAFQPVNFNLFDGNRHLSPRRYCRLPQRHFSIPTPPPRFL